MKSGAATTPVDAPAVGFLPLCTDWATVPIVVTGIEAFARIDGRSPRQIKRALADGTLIPRPFRRVGTGPRAAWQWKKAALQRFFGDTVAPRRARPARPAAPPHANSDPRVTPGGRRRAPKGGQ